MKVNKGSCMGLRFIKNLVGAWQGYSGCRHCGDSWYWKEEKEIPYRKGSAMFPLCKQCFNKLSEDDILDYCDKVFIRHRRVTYTEYNKYITRIKREIKRLKLDFDTRDVV